jgi:hypothetical protein
MPGEEEEFEVILPDGRRSVIKANRENTLAMIQKRAEEAAPALSEQDLRQMTQEQLIQKYLALQQSMTQMQSGAASASADWECGACTYVNSGHLRRCEMCDGANSQ